jgi:hypothetical protein
MEARRSRRIVVSLQAEIIAGDRRYASSIENLSNEGAYVVTAPTKFSQDFITGTPLELRFSFPSGEKLHLNCRVKWSYQTPPHGYTNSIGLEIINPPLTYQQILNTML